jgi:hypothetical protein
LYDLCEKGFFYGDILYISWTKEKTDGFLDLNFLNYVDEEAVNKLISSPIKGKEYDLIDTNSYYLYGLVVRAGRLVVVEQHELSLNEVQRNIKTWFEKMGDKKYSIPQLIGSICTESDSKGQKRHIWFNLYRQVLMSSILNKPIPQDIFNRVLDLELMNELVNDKSNPVRKCFIKLCLPNIDTNSVSYQYGTLIGKYSNLHRQALKATGNDGKNFVSQLLRGLFYQPQYNFELLVNRFKGLRTFYADKIDKKFPGRGTGLYNELMGKTFTIPERLGSTKEKAEFLLGYTETNT